jgi:ABC-type Zn2+ transport system substrate-binding protein/surface adhesin
MEDEHGHYYKGEYYSHDHDDDDDHDHDEHDHMQALATLLASRYWLLPHCSTMLFIFALVIFVLLYTLELEQIERECQLSRYNRRLMA